ncbi:MAG: hypothetical protein WCA44_05785 [Acidobacteriaceae bacterium]
MAAPLTKRLPRDFFDDAAPFKCDGVYCKLIPLTQGQFALIWLEDYSALSVFRWGAQWDAKMGSFYATRALCTEDRKRKVISMHRQILGLGFGDARHGDHAFHVTLDNRRFIGDKPNVRIADHSENGCNQKRSNINSTGFKGVTKDRDTYRARIGKNGKMKYLGARKTAEAAWRELYVPAALALHGEFARFV